MKNRCISTFCALALLFACQKEPVAPTETPDNPTPQDSSGVTPADDTIAINAAMSAFWFENYLGSYENYGLLITVYGGVGVNFLSARIKAEGQKIRVEVPGLRLLAVPATADSAIVEPQSALNTQTSQVLGSEGFVKIKNGVLTIYLASPNAPQDNRHYTFYYAEPSSEALSRNSYIGNYNAVTQISPIYTYNLRFEAGATPDAVNIHGVLGNLTVAGRVSGDTLYTVATPMDTLGNYLSATTSVLRGNVLDLSFVKIGPEYNPWSPTSSGYLRCYKSN
jgi:hypothetical protein